MTVRRCYACETAPWTCRDCGNQFCEHYCAAKLINADGSHVATCGTCAMHTHTGFVIRDGARHAALLRRVGRYWLARDGVQFDGLTGTALGLKARPGMRLDTSTVNVRTARQEKP